MAIMIILNQQPYDGTDVTWNALRLAKQLVSDGEEVRIFLMNDSVDLARDGIEAPAGVEDMVQMTKPKINFFWKTMPFRLNLRGYQGNCKTCWKKSDKKLWLIAKESPEQFNFMNDMEEKYPRVGAEFKKDETCVDRVFFRKHRSILIVKWLVV